MAGSIEMNDGSYMVIGGSRGIGAALVRLLTERGDEVRFSSRSADPSPDPLQFRFDAASGQIPGEIIPETLRGLVYCPGTINLKPFQRLTQDDFLADLETNLLGAVSSVKACLTALKKSPGGASIVLFSTVAVQTGMPFHSSIAAAKGAVEGLTRSLAAELAPRIRVNATAPSLTDTSLAAGLLDSDDKRRASADRHPLKRIGTPEDIARLAVYLLGDESGWISGQIIHVDGGMGALRTFK
jgi:NAD(P)-dependent dehydrogenase (short-subunit alcohol dehydrogenase family)